MVKIESFPSTCKNKQQYIKNNLNQQRLIKTEEWVFLEQDTLKTQHRLMADHTIFSTAFFQSVYHFQIILILNSLFNNNFYLDFHVVLSFCQ